MHFSSNKIRPLLTIAFVAIGAYAGNSLAMDWITFLDNYIRSGSASEPLRFFNLFEISQVGLSEAEKLQLSLVFIMVGALLGFAIERVAFNQAQKLQTRFETMAPQDKIAIVIGLVIGLVLTALLQSIVGMPLWLTVSSAVIFCYLSVMAVDSMKEQIRFYFPNPNSMYYSDKPKTSIAKLLDTNVIIDGRIADICRAGFLEGPIIVPKFVLEELQQIADSSDSLKRARGRRGLEILNQMQDDMEFQVPDFSTEDPSIDVDAKLVLMANDIKGLIVTNDYNLNKVAELQGVRVLNINELANALKPVVLPGEEMQVAIIKEGKEKEQGIGYLDDGTMIVVENARHLQGETLDVVVTSVLQTVQGKMIFAKNKEDQDNEGQDGNFRSYPGGRSRSKIR